MVLILYGVVFVFAGWDTCSHLLRRSVLLNNNYGIILIFRRQPWSKWFFLYSHHSSGNIFSIFNQLCMFIPLIAQQNSIVVVHAIFIPNISNMYHPDLRKYIRFSVFWIGTDRVLESLVICGSKPTTMYELLFSLANCCGLSLMNIFSYIQLLSYV